ncbi:MAG: peptidase M3 [Myxococcales bacterium]|nr:peptidase M3 [Myxococcales bacterium]
MTQRGMSWGAVVAPGLAFALACGGPTQDVQTSPLPPPAPLPPPPLPPPPPEAPTLQVCRQRIAKVRELRASVIALAAQPTRTTLGVVDVFNDLEMELGNAENEPALFRAVHPDASVRDAASQCEQLVAGLRTELSLDRALYEAFAGLDASAEAPDVRRMVAKTVEDFQRAGVDKDAKTRERISKIRDELVEVGQRFDKAIASDVRTVRVRLDQCKGLPQDWIDGHKPNSDPSKTIAELGKPIAEPGKPIAEPGQPSAGPTTPTADGLVAVTTNYTDYIPFMSYADDDSARKELYLAYRQRGWPQNKDNLQRLLELRAELAGLLGFANWAAYDTANKMIKSDKNIEDFIAKITQAADKRMQREAKLLFDELRKTDKSANGVADWQQAYLLGRLKKAKYAFDAQAMRPYLAYDKVKQGLLDLTSKLFGVTYKPNADKQRWHPDVEVFDVYEGDKLYGTIYLDMHPRDNKYKHAAQFSLRNGVLGKQLPEGVLVCNFPSPKQAGGWMEHKDVETFFHEFGHLIHHTFGGHQRWARFSGVATEMDFVEAPSQIFEEWAIDYATLATFAKNAAGKVVPKDLVAKLKGSDEFGKGLWVRHQMFYAGVSVRLHVTPPAAIDQDKIVEAEQNGHSPYPFVPETHMQASFGHLNGYSSNYYTYMWSMVIAKDMFSAFQKGGILNPAVAKKYRQAVLEPGGMKDAADLVADFLGRPYSFKSYEDWLNLGK